MFVDTYQRDGWASEAQSQPYSIRIGFSRWKCRRSAALTTTDWSNLNTISSVMSTDQGYNRLMKVLLTMLNAADALHAIGVE